MSWPGSRNVGFNGQAGSRYKSVLIRFYTTRMLNLSLVFSALKSLWLLGAIDNDQKLTPVGRTMASFPLESSHARAVVASKEYGCTSEILHIVSILSSSSKLFLDLSDQREAVAEMRLKFRHPSGDHFTILNAIRAYEEISASGNKSTRREWCRKHFLNERALLEARDIREQLKQTCARVGIDWKITCGENEDAVIRSLGHGLAMNSAFIQPDGSYKQTMGQSVSMLYPVK